MHWPSSPVFRKSRPPPLTSTISRSAPWSRAITGVRIEKDRLIHIREGGGGGWGAPFERPQEWVLDDVIDGLLSLERAADAYGVVIAAVDPDALDYRVDADATRSKRQELRQAATAEEAVS